ncbi:MAG: hypothetical protein ACOCQP_02045 [Lentisphaeria bacterium]
MIGIRKTLFIFLTPVIAGLLLVAIYNVMSQMNELREQEELVDTHIVENAPPMVAFTTVALGSFRGLVADFLWLRSAQAKEEGNYFEMMQLASWIVKLQPRFTDAAAYLAWNMAYNISVTFSDFEERWRWVQKGIQLLRDEALVYNPGDPELYWELGWIYQHKIGAEMDDANKFYKVQLAKQITNVLGTYPIDWEKWANTPSDAEQLQEELGDDSRFWNVLNQHALTIKELDNKFRQRNGFPEAIKSDLQDFDQLPLVERYLRKRWLEDVYKLDIQMMWELNRKYGELDWRLPEAHAIYWASKGLEKADENLSIQCERMIYQGLTNAFHSGRAIYVESADALQTTQNVELVDSVDDVYQETMEKHPDNSGIKSGYEYFLKNATVALYLFGRDEKADDYYDKLREEFERRNYRRQLEEFVVTELAGDLEGASMDKAQAIVYGYLYRTYTALAFGDEERALRLENMARNIWHKYMDSISGSEERRGLPPYEQMKQNVYRSSLEEFHSELGERLKSAEKELNENE